MTLARIAPRTRSLLGTAFVGAALLLAAAPTEALAAEIIVKAVKIKKRASTLTYQGGGGSEAVGRFEVGELSVTTTTETRFVDKVEGGRVSSTAVQLTFAVEPKDGASISKVALDLTMTDCTGAVKTERVSAIGERSFSAKFKLPDYTTCPWQLTHETVLPTDKSGTVRAYESAEKAPKDRCAADFKLGEVGFTTTAGPKDAPPAVLMSFDFDVVPDAPTRTDMLVQLTNCEGEKQVVRVSLEAMDGRYTGSASLPQTPSCPWVLTYGEVYVDGPCGDLNTWAIDFGQAKQANTNGTGTRSGASTVKATKPALK
jgi:hypothetical protein